MFGGEWFALGSAKTNRLESPNRTSTFPFEAMGAVRFALLLTIVSFPILKEYYARWHARRELAEVISEVDRLDPRWRLEDIEADRRQIAPGHNAAVVAAGCQPALTQGLATVLLNRA